MSIELLKLIISAITPILVAVIGYGINKRLKSIDDAQWQSRKIIDKRLELFDLLAPDINKIYCFCCFLGYWKEIPPDDMLKTKRDLDKRINIYQHLLSEEFYISYEEFIHLAFKTYTGHGKDALIRSEIDNAWGNRREHAKYTWKDEYDKLFDGDGSVNRTLFQEKYLLTMTSLRNCIGI